MKYNISRRDFLRQSSLAALAVPASRLDALALRQEKVERRGAPKRVVILGAGLAGLSAAYELSQAGHDVVVLEARTRAGGRVLTMREPFSDGMYAEAGAARIQDTHNFTLYYAKLFGLTLEPFWATEHAAFRHFGGRRVRLAPGQVLDLASLPLDFTEAEKKLGLPGMFQKYILPVVQELGDASAPDWPPGSLTKYDRVSWVEFLRGQGASPAAVALITAGHDLGEFSALYVLREFAHGRETKQWFKIKGGNDQLPAAFAARLSDKIRYGAPVVRVEQDARGVRAVFQQAGAPQTVAGEYVVCTIPFPVLKSIEVSPRFSPEKQRAVEQLTYLSTARVFLQARKRFWLDEGFSAFGLSDHPFELWEHTLGQPGARGVLGVYLTGAPSRRVTAMAEEARVRFGLEQVERIFPGVRENFEGGASKSWDDDPWARGAAAWLTPGQMAGLLPHVAPPEGRIHFAGEHTSPWNSWMQGALESGHRVARQVNEAP